MTALTTLWLNDKLADEMASSLNVTWSRSKPAIVMAGVTNGTGYVHCQDPTIGMTVTGEGDMKLFRLVCSLLLSEVEKASLSGTGLSVNSTFSTFMSAIMTGKHFKMTGNNKTVTIILEEDPSFKIIIDYETGIVKEITNINGFQCKGASSTESAYCYHDQLSNHLPEFISAVKQDLSNLFNQLGIGWIEDHYGEIKNGVEIIATGAGIIVTKLSILAAVEVMIQTGNGAIYFRDNYLPEDFWLKVSYHDIWNNDVYWYVDPNDNQMHYIEVPK